MSIANTKGVDISYAQGDINMSKVKNAGYGWVMIRVGQGTRIIDNQFAANVKKAEQLGMPWGVYLLTEATTTSEAQAEVAFADKLIKQQIAKEYKPTLPIAIDIEEAGFNSWEYTPSILTNTAKVWVEGMKKLGYYPMIYTGYYDIRDYLSKSVVNSCDIWLAEWGRYPDYTEDNLGMWQYGGETNLIESNAIAGVGVIDKDMCYKDYPNIIKNGGYNGWTKPTPTGIKLCCNKVHTYAWCQYAFWQTGATNPKWSTSNTQISKIDSNGVLSTNASGTTTVTVTDGKYSASCKVTIDNGKTTGISKTSLTLDKGQTVTLTAKVAGVSWFSSNPNVANVTNGKVTAKSEGYATISAYNKEGASTCLVKVTNKQYTPPVPAITETQLRQKVADTINGWLGAVEGDKVHAEILSIYNNQKNLPYGYKMGVHDAWCAATVSATWLKVGIADYICTDCNCGGFRDKAIKLGIWVEDDSYKPKIGDAIIYNWSDSGVGDNKGSADHIGLVTAINGNTFIVTEGNTGDGVVGKRTMQVDGRYIRGFITPNYADIAKKVAGKIMPDDSSNVDKPSIYIQGTANGKWLKVIKDGADYAGILGKALVALAAKVTKGTIEYSVHVKGGNWLGNITGWNYKDYINGYAGNGNPAEKGDAIDGVKMYYRTPTDVANKYGYYKAAYRVHLLGGGWLDWQYDTETTNGQDGYAGIFGKTIDAVQAKLVKS